MKQLKPSVSHTGRFSLISLVLVLSLGLGAWIGRESTEVSDLLHSEDRLSQTSDRLAHEMRLFESEIFGRAREALVETTSVGASSRSHPSLLAQIELPSGKLTARDPSLRASVESELRQIAMTDTRVIQLTPHGEKSTMLGFYKLGLGRPDLLVMAALGPSDTVRISAIEISLTEWAKRWNQTKSGSGQASLSRPLIWDNTGNVIFHPTASWRGRNLNRSPYFEAQVRPAFESQTEVQLGSRRSIDQLSVYTATAKLKRLPLAITLEESKDARLVYAASEISEGSLRKISGMVAAAFGILLVSAWFLSRQKTIHVVASAATPPPAPQSVQNPAQIDVQTQAQTDAAISAVAAGVARIDTPSQVQIAVQEFDGPLGVAPPSEVDATLVRFENDLRAARDLRRVTEILTQAVGAVYGSRALFFRYYEPGHALILSADSTGKLAVGSHQSMWSVPVSRELKDRVMKEGSRTPILSASNDESISRLLLVREGSGVFEGWGWTAFGGKSAARLLGLIVIPSPSSTALLRSETLRQNLFRIFQSAALVYENLLLSQTVLPQDALTTSRRHAQSLLPPQ